MQARWIALALAVALLALLAVQLDREPEVASPARPQPVPRASPAGELAAVSARAAERRRNPVAGKAQAGTGGTQHAPAPLPLRGRLVDERTDEPLPWFPLEVSRGGEPEPTFEALVTDELGRFTTERRFAPGDFDLALLDPDGDRSWYDEVERSVPDLTVEQELRVEVGPTYHLDLRMPPELRLSDLRATLSTASTRDDENWDPPPVRAGALPWVRLQPKDVRGAESSGPWTLEVLSAEGTWWGAAEVTSCVGRYPEIVTIELHSRGVLRGTVRDVRGEPVESAWARLEGEGDRREDWWLSAGRYEFPALAPGSWSLAIEPDHHEPYAAEVMVQAGRVAVHDVTLAEQEPAGDVTGLVTSATGTWRGDGMIHLWGYDGTRSNRRGTLGWEREGERLVHRFAFENVPAGTYQLYLSAPGCNYEILPRQPILVTVPAANVEIRVHDDVPTVDVAFRVRDARTGAELTAYDAWWLPPNGSAGHAQGAESGATLIEGWPRERALSWVVSAPGFGLALGELADHAQDEERWVIDVALEPGFGVQFFLRNADGNALEGIRLAFDGVELPPSGARGRVPFSAAERPRSIEVLTPGWRIVGGDVDPASSEFDAENWWALAIELEALDR